MQISLLALKFWIFNTKTNIPSFLYVASDVIKLYRLSKNHCQSRHNGPCFMIERYKDDFMIYYDENIKKPPHYDHLQLTPIYIWSPEVTSRGYTVVWYANKYIMSWLRSIISLSHPDDVRSISRDVAFLNTFVHDKLIILLC